VRKYHVDLYDEDCFLISDSILNGRGEDEFVKLIVDTDNAEGNWLDIDDTKRLLDVLELADEEFEVCEYNDSRIINLSWFKKYVDFIVGGNKYLEEKENE
jgi:hypothetical protein